MLAFEFTIVVSPTVLMDIDAVIPKVNGEKDKLNSGAPSFIYYILMVAGCTTGLLVFSMALITRMRAIIRRQRLNAEPVLNYGTFS